MVAGEFIDCYKDQKGKEFWAWNYFLEEWNVLATCFFIDTANNIIQYIKCIYKILKPGGLWVNCGPLLYHYTDVYNECSIELSWEEVEHIIKEVGFKFKEIREIKTTYAGRGKALMETVYNCVYFVAVKPLK